MGTKIFVKLPVKDLPKSKEFFSRIGFSFKEKFIADTAVSAIVADNPNRSSLPQQKYKEFTPKRFPNTSRSTGVLIAISYSP